jgi:hypothetical protein
MAKEREEKWGLMHSGSKGEERKGPATRHVEEGGLAARIGPNPIDAGGVRPPCCAGGVGRGGAMKGGLVGEISMLAGPGSGPSWRFK